MAPIKIAIETSGKYLNVHAQIQLIVMVNMKAALLIVVIAALVIILAAAFLLNGKSAAIAPLNNANSPITSTIGGVNITESQFTSLIGNNKVYNYTLLSYNGSYSGTTADNKTNATFANVTHTYIAIYKSAGPSSNEIVVEWVLKSATPKTLVHYIKGINFDPVFNVTNVTSGNLTYSYGTIMVAQTNKNYSKFILEGATANYSDFVGISGDYIIGIRILGVYINQSAIVKMVSKQIS